MADGQSNSLLRERRRVGRSDKARGKTAHVGRHKSVVVADIQTWGPLRSITVPLIEPFGWKMDAGAWRDVQRPKILRSEDFDVADGIYLHGFICRDKQVRNLVRRWRVATRHWSAGGRDNLRLVVLVEPMVAHGAPRSVGTGAGTQRK